MPLPLEAIWQALLITGLCQFFLDHRVIFCTDRILRGSLKAFVALESKWHPGVVVMQGFGSPHQAIFVASLGETQCG